MKISAFIVVLMLVAGFMMKPAQAYACGSSTSETEKSSCKKESVDNTQKQGCCATHQQNAGKHGNGCSKNCKHPLCNCTVVNFVYTLPFSAEINNRALFLPAAKKIDSCNEGTPSAGFFTIWLPPKIS
jgi:hypothetical protein